MQVLNKVRVGHAHTNTACQPCSGGKATLDQDAQRNVICSGIEILLQFGSRMSPKGPGVGGLVPSGVYLEVVEKEVGPSGSFRSWGCGLGAILEPRLFLLSFASDNEMSSFLYPALLSDVLPYDSRGLKPLKLNHKNLSFSELVISGIFSQ